MEFVSRQNITADYLVLPGDITHTAHPQEVEIASDFVLEAAHAMQVPIGQVVFVPGNHDVDWSAYDAADTTGLRWAQRYAWIGHDNFTFRAVANQGQGNVFSNKYFVFWEFDDLLVFGYNSSSHDAPVHEDVAHHGLADPEHFVEIRECLEAMGEPDGRVRLFLVHHHPLDFCNPIPRVPDFSLMTNAEALLDLCHECHFDMIIHGHKHHPRFETHSTTTYPHLPILCSGSFSVELDTQWAGTVDNQFHLVSIIGRAGSENAIKGTVTSWTNNRARGWIPSVDEASGIHHVIPFGSYVMPRELDSRLEPFVQEWLTNHDHVLWSDVVNRFPDLEHLPLKSAIAAFERLEQLLGRRSMYQTLKDLMIY